jgi:hypothetical protein
LPIEVEPLSEVKATQSQAQDPNATEEQRQGLELVGFFSRAFFGFFAQFSIDVKLTQIPEITSNHKPTTILRQLVSGDTQIPPRRVTW